jgi:hypothetical protein
MNYLPHSERRNSKKKKNGREDTTALKETKKF